MPTKYRWHPISNVDTRSFYKFETHNIFYHVESECIEMSKTAKLLSSKEFKRKEVLYDNE